MKLASNIKRLSRRVTNGTLAVLFLLFSANLVPLLPVSQVAADSTTVTSITAKALTGHECNDTEWHFVITQVDTESDAPASIHVTWANGNQEDVLLNKFTGGTAHYLTTDNLNSTVTSATANIYSGWSGEFNLSHGPCTETPETPSLSTQVSTTPITLGQSVTDTATLSGTQGDVTGTVDFYACGPTASNEDCTTGGTPVGSDVAVTNGSAISDSFTPTVIGSYCFRAEYTPDGLSNYLATTHTNSDTECFTVNAAPVYGSITIEKNAVPDSSQAFHFTTTGLSTDATGFDLVDDSTVGLPQQVFSNLGAGTYTVSETATSGWDFAKLTCDNDGAVVTPSGSTVSITLSGAQNVVCTYTNKERGTITVYKVTDPANDPTGFPISLATTTAGATVTESPSQTLTTSTPVVYHVSQGTYNVAEDLSNLPNWQTTDNGCGSITVNSANLNATCTITNTKYISLSGTKWEVNADGSAVGQTGLSGWTINLYKNGVSTGQSAVTGNDGSYSFNNLVDDGTYTVTETMINGWTQVCAPLAVSHCATGVNDFGNFKNATISGYKWNDENADGKHQKSEPKLAGWTIFIDANGNGRLDNGEVSAVTDSNGNYSFGDLAPGRYRLCEVMQAGWVQTAPGTKSGCSNVTVKTSGKTYHRNFGNYRPQQQASTATVTIVKDAQPDSSQAFSFQTNANQAGTFSLTDDGTGTGNSITFANLPLREGAYTFSEDQVNGWQLSDIQCNTEDNWGVDGQLYVYPSAGDNITCTFTNVAQPATVTIVKKAYPVSPLSFDFTTDLSGSSQTFGLTDNGTDASLASHTFIKVAPGTYTIDETELTGWALLGADCGQGVTTSLKGTELTLTVPAGADITCTFTNQQQGGHILGSSTVKGGGGELVNTGKNLLAGVLASLTILGTALAVAVSRRQQTTL